MIVCICKGVNDKQLVSAAEKACGSLKKLKCELGVGHQCGRCERLASEILSKAIGQNSCSISSAQ